MNKRVVETGVIEEVVMHSLTKIKEVKNQSQPNSCDKHSEYDSDRSIFVPGARMPQSNVRDKTKEPEYEKPNERDALHDDF